jgi:hypothetical protein
MAARSYDRNEMVRRRDESATSDGQIIPASNMWEYFMLAKQSFGRADRAAWRHGVPSYHAGAPDKGLAQACQREREQKIERAIAALTKLDDRTLIGLGISHRSHIEWTVRYCHDC